MNAVLKQSLKGIFLAAVVLVAGSAFAASKGSLELQHPTNVGGTQLAGGNYTVQWDGTGDQVELKIFQGKNAVATTSARVVKVERPEPHNATVTVTNGDGTSSLSQIRFGGKKYALEISNEGGASGAAGAVRLARSVGRNEESWRAKGRADCAARIAKQWPCLSSAICLRT